MSPHFIYLTLIFFFNYVHILSLLPSENRHCCLLCSEMFSCFTIIPFFLLWISLNFNFKNLQSQCSSVFKIRSETCWTEAQFYQNLYMIKKESLLDQSKFCQSGFGVRHLFWRLVHTVLSLLKGLYLTETPHKWMPYCFCMVHHCQYKYSICLWFWSASVQVIAHCLTAPSDYLIPYRHSDIPAQCYFVVDWNVNQNFTSWISH